MSASAVVMATERYKTLGCSTAVWVACSGRALCCWIFEQARAHLGMETQRQWNDQAIVRTTPVILALFSLVALSAYRLGLKQPLPGHTTAWYPNPNPTFADALAWIRQRLWQTFYTSANQHHLMKIPKTLFNRLIHTLSYAT